MSRKNAISPRRDEDYSEWYQQVIKAADLAQHSPVRGCMVIRPWGYGIWENIQKQLDKRFKELDIENAYFPLFIPVSFLEKEAEHVDGFAKECAVVTHHRLEKKGDKLIPSGKLDQPLVVRPTSEMIIGHMFAKWIQSYKDLPLKINQWANVVRWELRTRLFLRTTEFLWQEGHTAYSKEKEAKEDALKMLDLYASFSNDILAMPSIKGEKTESEKFPGAVSTFSFEYMMQDKKALQAGTSHFLGQKFAKSCDIKFTDENGDEQLVWTTSWGVTTRLIGGLVMMHGDDNGIVLPPKIAPLQIVILPIIHIEEKKKEVLSYCEKLLKALTEKIFNCENVKAKIDSRDIRGGEKKWNWIKKGVPLIVEIGPKDIENNKVAVTIRNSDLKVQFLRLEEFVENIDKLLDKIQNDLYENSLKFMMDNMVEINTKEEFYEFFTPKNTKKPEIHGGFALCYFCEDKDIEAKISEELGVTVRNIPFDLPKEEGYCIFSGKKSEQRVVFAKSY